MATIPDDVKKPFLEPLTPQQRLEGLTPQQRLAGLSIEERLAGLTPEEMRRAVSELQRRIDAHNPGD